MNKPGIDWHARAIQVAFLAGVIALWYLVGATGKINTVFLPELPRVIEKFGDRKSTRLNSSHRT